MHRMWGAALMGAGIAGWIFPDAPGNPYAAEVTTGEAQIMASIFFVGGMILYFLHPKPPES